VGQLNLYRIDAQKQDDFAEAIEEKYNMVGNTNVIDTTIGNHLHQFELTFYVDIPDEENRVDWSWLLQHFGDNGATSRSNPKGILVIEENGEMFACTYGFSYFIVDKYCDTDFAFEFARRIRYKEVKTTTLLSPNLRRNKVVNTYLDYNDLEFDSGESFAKLKVKADLPDEFEIFEPSIEVGHSIKFSVPNDTVSAILEVLIYVRDTLAEAEVVYRIPVFNRVSDKGIIENLRQRLATSLEDDPLAINLSELDIIGVTEIFNRNDATFILKCGWEEEEVDQLTAEVVAGYITQSGLTLFESLEKIRIISLYNGNPVRTDAIYNLIDYTDDEMRCVLSKGKWYRFNDDYLGYLSSSLSEIDTIYNPQYDFGTVLYEQFVNSKYDSDKDDPIYAGLEQSKVKDKLKTKYYKERAYNLYLSETFGFECHDRIETRVGDLQIELTDLYKDETLYSVKIGSTSSKLCYVLDQSTSTMKLYKHKLLHNLPEAKRIGIWLLLDRRTHLDIVDGKPDINQLDMLMLKNRIDAWKKEVRLLGLDPVIAINYLN